MYNVRFHLQHGPHYMHWQIRGKDGSLEYVNPEEYDLEMFDCTLVCKTNKAKKVYNAGRKDVCGWVECEEYIMHQPGTLLFYHELERLYFNPIRDIHWRRDDDGGGFAWDGSVFNSLVTKGKNVYVLEECGAF